jgi:hypothetical protein
MTTITWGETQFEGPSPATKWSPPKRAAVYVIMMKPDPSKTPTPYQSIYFGESGNLTDQGFWRRHQAYPCFMKHAKSEANITETQRQQLAQRLIDACKPLCNQ